jgi:hypothetical protein
MDAGLGLRLIVENLDFAALNVRCVIEGHTLEWVIGLDVSHAVLEPGKIARIQDDSRRDEYSHSRF